MLYMKGVRTHYKRLAEENVRSTLDFLKAASLSRVVPEDEDHMRKTQNFASKPLLIT